MNNAIASIAVLLAAFLVGCWIGNSYGTSQQRAHYEPILRAQAERARQAEAQARQIEREAAQKVARISDEGLRQLAEVESRYQASLRDLNTGNIRLRRELTACSSRVPSTALDSSVDHGTEDSGLRQAVIGDLLRVGRDANAVVEQLTACQALHR